MDGMFGALGLSDHGSNLELDMVVRGRGDQVFLRRVGLKVGKRGFKGEEETTGFDGEDMTGGYTSSGNANCAVASQAMSTKPTVRTSVWSGGVPAAMGIPAFARDGKPIETFRLALIRGETRPR